VEGAAFAVVGDGSTSPDAVYVMLSFFVQFSALPSKHYLED